MLWVLPSLSENIPEGHGVHTFALLIEIFPGEQRVQIEEAERVNVPAG